MVSKRSYVHASAVPYHGVHDAQNGGVRQALVGMGLAGWVYRVGNTGSGTPPSRFARGEVSDSEAGPGRPIGPGVGGH